MDVLLLARAVKDAREIDECISQEQLLRRIDRHYPPEPGKPHSFSVRQLHQIENGKIKTEPLRSTLTKLSTALPTLKKRIRLPA